MTNRTDADLLQVLLRQVREDRSSISFSRKAASYSSRPRLRSQTMTSMTAPQSGLLHIIVVRGECPGGHELPVTGVTWAIRRAPGGLVDTVKRISFP